MKSSRLFATCVALAALGGSFAASAKVENEKGSTKNADIPHGATVIEIGGGYGRSTPRGVAALAAATPEWPRLDGVYSGKAMAAALRLHRNGVGPLLFWATKSTLRLPPPSPDALRTAPARAP